MRESCMAGSVREASSDRRLLDPTTAPRTQRLWRIHRRRAAQQWPNLGYSRSLSAYQCWPSTRKDQPQREAGPSVTAGGILFFSRP